MPLVLTEVDKYLPTEDGEPPLARATNWRYKPHSNSPQGGEDGGASYPYEHSTMPGWAGSSWYFLRYMDAKNSGQMVSKQLADYWQQVDLYIGGSEHATGHLLYVRFWTKFLKDLGYIAIDEPAKKLINQGMIQGRSNFVYRVNGENKLVSAGLKNNYEVSALHVDVSIVNNDILDIEAFKKWREDFKSAEFILEDGKYICGHEVEKMSKSKYNVVTPDDIGEKFGADTLRLYEMFLGPLEQSKPWNTNGITGVHGFLKKLWRLFYPVSQGDASLLDSARRDKLSLTDEAPTKGELKTLHKTIKKITEDIERFSFNTSVSNFMICVNELTDAKCNKKSILEPLLICLSPYAPHITEELWRQLGHTESISTAPFPDFNEAYLVDDNINYPVSFNGKLKFTLELPATLTVQEVEAEIIKNEQTQKLLEGKQPKKVIVVHKKIVNLVV